ncbi:MAG TPA: hypothetical protein VIH04_07125 [Nitrosarchaeum sp.]
MGVFKEDTLEYVDYQKKIRQIIENLTEEKSKKIGISRRGFFYLKRKLESTDKPLRLKEKILIRLNNFFSQRFSNNQWKKSRKIMKILIKLRFFLLRMKN